MNVGDLKKFLDKIPDDADIRAKDSHNILRLVKSAEYVITDTDNKGTVKLIT